MEVIKLKSWEEFEGKIEKERDEFEILKKDETYSSISEPLFRGHANAEWRLSTTLERFSINKKCAIQEYTWERYYKTLQAVEPAILSQTKNKYDLSEYKIDLSPVPTGYEFMVYLRHHGFPSPLLDWTKSPYVAAFFSFDDAKDGNDVAIYMFREYVGNAKGYYAGEPHIGELGPYVVTHRRHYQQQCQYTVCYREVGDKRVYCCHENVQYGEEQDLLKKYVIPSKERKKILKKLDLMNINSFSLFGNEEGLMSTLAYREIERRE